MYGWEFEKLKWRLKRELKGNRKPILLFFGNGYESQILALALYRLRKPFIFVHVNSPQAKSPKVMGLKHCRDCRFYHFGSCFTYTPTGTRKTTEEERSRCILHDKHVLPSSETCIDFTPPEGKSGLDKATQVVKAIRGKP